MSTSRSFLAYVHVHAFSINFFVVTINYKIRFTCYGCRSQGFLNFGVIGCPNLTYMYIHGLECVTVYTQVYLPFNVEEVVCEISVSLTMTRVRYI